MKSSSALVVLLHLLFYCKLSSSFSVLFMGARRGKGELKRVIESSDKNSNNPPSDIRSLNQGKGQEITGVTLPADGKLKGWEFGQGVRMVCANVGGRLYALQGDCPRCAFDLWKGDLLVDDPGFEDLPRVACPTCSTTYSLRSGSKGPPLKRTGLQAFVGNLAKTATASESYKDAKAFLITRDL